MKNIYLLGATGSIGTQTIEIIEKHPTEFKLIGISGFNNLNKIIEITNQFDLQIVSVKDEADALKLKALHPELNVVYGEDGLCKVSCFNPEDKQGVLINSLVGMVGLKPTIESIKIKRDILLANKETLVVGGHLIKDLLDEYKVNLYPIDSEHNALWQAMQGENIKSIKRLLITASGGSFRDLSRDELKNVTLKEALNHPNWSMGSKITIDSATMMNKGFEIIEAAYLFDIDIDCIEPVIHRESIIHSMVEYIDNSVIAQLAIPDMRLPISYAMFYPKRVEAPTPPLDFKSLSKLSFEPVNYERYPMVKMAIDAFKTGGSQRTVLNAANEAAVALFLNEKIRFIDIEAIVSDELANHKLIHHPSLEEIYKIDTKIKQNIFARYDK